MSRSRSSQRVSTSSGIGKNAERERNRVRCLRAAFQTLQGRLPTVPPNTKLSKLDILILATNYINQLTKILEGASIQESALNQHLQNKFFHPIKKWPMRKRLYSRIKSEVDDVEEVVEEEMIDDSRELQRGDDKASKRRNIETHLPEQCCQHIQKFEQLQLIETEYSEVDSIPKSFITLQESQSHFQMSDYLEKYDPHFDLVWIPPFDYSL